MVYYTERKSRVYLETTVVSYLAARLSRDPAVASMQQMTQQLWEDYLVSWNQKHIVNQYKREHINQVCLEAGFEPITVCTPAELIARYQMKEAFENYTDPILEECYRIKKEISSRFNSVEELSAHLREVQEECKRKGMKVVSYYEPPSERKKPKVSTGTKDIPMTD